LAALTDAVSPASLFFTSLSSVFFSVAKMVYSDPIYVSNKLDYNETSDVIEKCEAKLNLLQQEAQIFSN